MEIDKIGEFNLIEKLTSILHINDKSVIVGFGDDCACVDINGKLLLFSNDTQVEDIHFIKEKIPPEDLGWKLISINVSDIVSCGGLPRWSLISVMLPKTLEFEFLNKVYEGIQKALDFYGFSLVGGNTTASKTLTFDLFIVGETKRFVPRSGGKPGNILFLSGYTGLSRIGLELLLSGKEDFEDWEKEIIKFHTRPYAQIDFQPVIERYANSCIDVSDGLAGDLGHIQKQSNVKVVIEEESLPIHPLLKKYCEKYNKNPLDYILYGGEDYQLVFSVPEEMESFIEKGFKIGFLEEGTGLFLKRENSLTPLEEKGFEHI